MLFQRWAIVYDAGPTLKQNWFNTSCLLCSRWVLVISAWLVFEQDLSWIISGCHIHVNQRSLPSGAGYTLFMTGRPCSQDYNGYLTAREHTVCNKVCAGACRGHGLRRK